MTFRLKIRDKLLNIQSGLYAVINIFGYVYAFISWGIFPLIRDTEVFNIFALQFNIEFAWALVHTHMQNYIVIVETSIS